jgi:hypothetical protein
MEATVETVLLVGLAWMAFKALLTVLLLLGAGPVLRRTPLAPLVARVEEHPLLGRLRSRLPWSVWKQRRANADTTARCQSFQSPTLAPGGEPSGHPPRE